MFIEDDVSDYLIGVTSSIEAIEEEKDYFTGLYNSSGGMLFRKPNKIGFIHE